MEYLFLEAEISIQKSSKDSKIGEIIFEGKNVSLGYAYNANDLALGDQNNGILRTGDLGYVDDEGYFFITGRKSRFIKINGVRVSLDYLEQLLETEFSAVECICYGEDDNLSIDYKADDEHKKEITKFLSKEIKIFHKLIQVRRVESIKRNNFGKKIYT